MNARDLASRLGLDKQARSWRGACPNCAYPRAFSIRARGETSALLFCANGCTREDLDATVARVAGGAWTLAARFDDADAAAARTRKQAAALRLWNSSAPASGTLADAYLTARGLSDLAGCPALRFRGDTPHPEGGWLPAMVALVQNAEGAPVAVHRTYLRRDGRGKADAEPAKASLGPVWGGVIRLKEIDPALPLVVGEGLESSASAGRLTGFPAWAAISAGNLARGLVLPVEARRLVIAVDPDPAGERAAQQAAERWAREGRHIQLARPTGSGDFNDVLSAQAAAAHA